MATTMRFFDIAQGQDAECIWARQCDCNTPIPRHGDEVVLGDDVDYIGHVTHVNYWYVNDSETYIEVWLNLEDLPE